MGVGTSFFNCEDRNAAALCAKATSDSKVKSGALNQALGQVIFRTLRNCEGYQEAYATLSSISTNKTDQTNVM